MDEITVKVSDLCELVAQLKADKMQYARLVLLEADEDLPASVICSAIKSEASDQVVDYDSIDAVPISF